MARPSHRPHPPTQWLRRLDRAAAEMNPVLVVLAIGLALLNLTCFVLLAPYLPITRLSHGSPACLTGAARGGAAAIGGVSEVGVPVAPSCQEAAPAAPYP
jgi:hypothetical protein